MTKAYWVCLDPTCEDENLEGMKAFLTYVSAMNHQMETGHAFMHRIPGEKMEVDL